MTPNRLWKIALLVALLELSLVLAVIAALGLGAGGVVFTVSPRQPVGVTALAIPVAGIRPGDLTDSYGAARSGGRSHKGIDIFAPAGTPALAAGDAVVVERSTSALGGISLYLRSIDGVTVYYYAHLQGYRGGLKVGHLVRRGEVVGYVGRTGNVQGGAHLHFAVYTVPDPNRWWTGTHFNPYSLLAP